MREGTIKAFVATRLQKKAMTKAQIAAQIVKKFPHKKPEAMERYMGVVFGALRKEGFRVDVVGQDRSGANKYALLVGKARKRS